jgi:hypothetical protein
MWNSSAAELVIDMAMAVTSPVAEGAFILHGAPRARVWPPLAHAKAHGGHAP